MTLRGSLAIVKMNIAKGRLKAVKVQPKNSIIVILISSDDYKLSFICSDDLTPAG